MGFKTRARLEQHRFDSAVLGNSRSVWVQRSPASPRPRGVLLFLDGEHYLEDIGAVAIVETLRHQADFPALLPVYVSHVDYPTRWRESFCNDDFAAALATELVPWISEEFDVGGGLSHAVVGLSLTGLAAAHAGLQHPAIISRVHAQSGSFWWQDGWLIDEVSRRRPSALALSLSVGLDETDDNVDHGDGLVQKESQLSSNRRMREALAARGFRTTYREFDGGHDLASFRQDLPVALRQLLEIEPPVVNSR